MIIAAILTVELHGMRFETIKEVEIVAERIKEFLEEMDLPKSREALEGDISVEIDVTAGEPETKDSE